MSSPAWREATLADEPVVLALLEAFYAEEHLTFDAARARRSLHDLLTSHLLGRIFLLHETRAPSSAAPSVPTLGYLVLTFGFSLEFGGRFVLLDEFYLAPVARGRGWGKLSLDFAATWSRTQAASALRLELNHANTRVRSLYLKSGFTDDRRDLFTRHL